MLTDGVVGVGRGKGIRPMTGRRMSLRGVVTVEEIGSSDDSEKIDAADTWLLSVNSPVCQLTDPQMPQYSPKTDARTILLN